MPKAYPAEFRARAVALVRAGKSTRGPLTSWINEIFQYLGIFHNRQRRHSKIGYLTPVEHERIHELHQPA